MSLPVAPPCVAPPLLALAALAWLAAGGCAHALEPPHDRLGALPFPGALTLYHAADPAYLGGHCYERTPKLFVSDESDGILYTTRAGFLDLAHVRITVDTVRYCNDQISTAIRQRRPSVTLYTLEGSAFTVHLNYAAAPPLGINDDDDSADARAQGDEIALRIAQRVAYLMMNWHEVLTWFGWRTVQFIDESPSAFTYDDTMSHVIGLRIAGKVLREPIKPSKYAFDDAVTVALREELKALGAVTPAETDRACHAVEGMWWSHGKPLKRQLDVGLTDGVVRPWLVRIPPTAGTKPAGLNSAGATPTGAMSATTKSAATKSIDVPPGEAFVLPTLRDIDGRDFSAIYTIQIDPLVPEGDRLRDAIPSHPAVIDGERDMPPLVEATRQQMQQQLSADVDQPVPTRLAARPTTAPHNLSLAPPLAPSLPPSHRRIP